MNCNELISNIHWIAVAVLTLLSFVIGFIWHRPFLFGKSWKKENNPDDKPVKINAPLIFGGTAVLHFLATAGLSAGPLNYWPLIQGCTSFCLRSQEWYWDCGELNE